MNTRERFLATMRFAPVDRPFRWESHFFWSQTIDRWHAEGLPAEIDGGNIDAFFGMDRFHWIPVDGWWAGTPFCPMFDEEIIEEQGENIVVRERDGVIKKRRKAGIDGTAPQLLQFPVETREDFAALQWRLDPTDRRRLPADWERLTAEYAVRDYPLGMFVIGSFGQPRNLLGDINLMMTLYDDPEFFHAIMRHWVEFYRGYIGLVCERVIPDFLMIWEDSCYRNGPLISPESYQEFMAPYLKEIITLARGKGITNFVVDCDGDLRKLIPYFLDCGVNAFFPCEVQSGVDIVALRKEYGNRFALFGGLDKRQLAVSREAIKDEITRKVPYMLAEGGYFPGIDHGCPPDVSYENYRYFTELVRDIGPF